MKITKEEFKELVEVCRETWENIRNYDKYYSEEVRQYLHYPIIHVINNICELPTDYNGFPWLLHLTHEKEELDLDTIYEEYVGGKRK